MNRHYSETTVQVAPSLPMEHHEDATRNVDAEPAARDLHFRELVNILHRRIRLILAIALCGTAFVFAIGLLMPPKYTGKAQIAIDPSSSPTEAAASMRDDGAAIETHVTVLLSRDHLQRVLDNLRDDPEFHPTTPTVHGVRIEGAASQSPRTPAAGWLPGPSDLARRLTIWTAMFRGSGDETTLTLDDLERRLRINQEGRSRVITVSYTSKDPDIAAIVANRIAELYVERLRKQTRAYAGTEVAQLDSRIADLKSDVDRSRAAVQDLMLQRTDAAKPPSEARQADQHLQELEREAVAKGQLYQTLLRRQQEIRNQPETEAPAARIPSLAATPELPSSPNPFLFIFPALILFLICGSLLAVILEKLDRGLRSEREINEALGVPCIGLVPLVAEIRTDRRLHQTLLTKPLSAYADAFRSIAATLQLASPLHKRKVVLVTSSMPGEGKTTLAVSLSVCAALLQQRVLLIDLDFKRPSILRELDGKAEHGILDLLLKNRQPTEVIQYVPELGLDYLPMNRCSIDPMIALAGEEMPQLLHQLRGSYDCVIIDSSPVLGSAETRLLAAMADEILFLVKWGSTSRELAQNALGLLRSHGSFPAQQLQPSVVIAQVDLKKHVRYGDGDVGEYFLNYEKYSSRSSEATAAITLRKTATLLFGIWSHIRRLRISTSLLGIWSQIGRRHSKPSN